MALFFGDSITEGSNCDCSFVDYLKEIGINLAISGTTIGEYSIYPVDGNSLLSQIAKYQDKIKKAGRIYLEYGCNDVTAIMCGFATMQTVIISLVKAIDWIRQLNRNAEIIFLELGSDKVIKQNSENMCNYLQTDYFAMFDLKFPATKYFDLYKTFIDNVKKVCNNVKSMFSDNMVDEWEKYLSNDNLHPNKLGHKEIAKNIESM